MQVQLFTIFSESTSATQPDRILSFDRFLRHLKQLCDHHPSRKDVLAFVLNRFERMLAQQGGIRADNLSKFTKELYYLYNLYVPLLTNEGTALWGLAFPLSGQVFYSTDAFYDFSKREKLTKNNVDQGGRISVDQGILLIYQLIFERLYGFSDLGFDRFIYAVTDDSAILPRYYALVLDNAFVDVFPKGELPALDYRVLQGKETQGIHADDLNRMLPLDRFRVEGFSIVSMTDITHEYVIEELKKITIRGGGGDYSYYQQAVESNLRVLTGISELHARAIPVLKLNGKPMLYWQLFKDSVLVQAFSGRDDDTQLLSYLENPQPMTFGVDFLDGRETLIEEIATKLDVGSLAIIPLFHKNQVVGLLELYTDQGIKLTRNALANLRHAIPLLTQFVNDIKLDFKTRTDKIILDRYTALQPAVQWKFNEAAWAYLREDPHIADAVGHIRFAQVYPLYGAVDIRNSTLKRNEALLADLSQQLELLHNTLLEIDALHAVPHYLIQRTEELEKRLRISQLDYVHMAISQFVNEDVSVAFHILKRAKDPQVNAIIREYEEKMDAANNGRNRNRQAFETSVQQINQTISRHLDEFNEQIQTVFPSYFEKFRTDGIEFDYYVGQSISPHLPFHADLLRKIKRLQLEVMAVIANETRKLAGSLPVYLETTQLIFINNGVIDINFREDERRFDVEGAYNIRYHVIKKRIDKALVKGSGERVTQPGKITLVYLHEETLYDYLVHIEALQKSGILTWQMEYLEVEELQGVSGLRALRVSIAG